MLVRKKKKPRPARIWVGWREWVALPDLGIEAIKAKVDTGARTSALHAGRVHLFEERARRRVRFTVHPIQRSGEPNIVCVADLVDHRQVTSSAGHREYRPVIVTRLTIGEETWPIELTLTNRDSMGFRMLIGRRAMRRRLVVDPGRSFLTRIYDDKAVDSDDGGEEEE